MVPGMNRGRVFSLSLCAVLSALVFVFSFINIKLPLPGNGGLVHLGNIPVTVAAIAFGKKQSAASGAIGMSLFDLMGGYAVWAPFTFVIRLGSGFLIGLIAGKRRGESLWINALAVLAGGLVMAAGYYLSETIIYGNYITPLMSVPGDLLQIASALVLGLPLATGVSAALRRGR